MADRKGDKTQLDKFDYTIPLSEREQTPIRPEAVALQDKVLNPNGKVEKNIDEAAQRAIDARNKK
jgi:hypothetical protein